MSLRGKKFFDDSKEKPSSFVFGTLPKILSVAPPPACQCGAVLKLGEGESYSFIGFFCYAIEEGIARVNVSWHFVSF